jgi:hypothetical protein
MGVLTSRMVGMLMREDVLMGRAPRICSPQGRTGEETGVEALFEGPTPGFDESGNEVSDLLANAFGWATLIAEDEACAD